MPERSLQSRKTAVAQILKDPELFPDEFKSWLRSYLNNHPDIIWEQSQIPGSIPGSKISPGSFLSLLTSGTDRKAAFGNVVLTWGGGSVFTNAPNINHGLGAVPAFLASNALGATAAIEVFSPISLGSTVFSSTQFSAQARTVDGSIPAAGHTLSICWLAIA